MQNHQSNIETRIKKKLIIVLLGLMMSGVLSCSALREDYPLDQKLETSYSWSNFFNNHCGPVTEIIKDGYSELAVLYQCANGVKIAQQAKLHAIKNRVELWAAYQISAEQLYQISSSKCQVSLIYIGRDHATINYPCALVHLTVGYVINSINAIDGRLDINLLPNKLLITFSDGIQEFNVEGEDLIPSTPFRPFKKPAPSLTRNK